MDASGDGGESATGGMAMTPTFPYDEWSEFKRSGKALEAVRGADDVLLGQLRALGSNNLMRDYYPLAIDPVNAAATRIEQLLASHRALVELVECARLWKTNPCDDITSRNSAAWSAAFAAVDAAEKGEGE